jgi:hypothetical protein
MDQITSNSNNQLFAADKDWWNNACVNFLPDHLSGCAEGYKEAADILVSTNKSDFVREFAPAKFPQRITKSKSEI